MAETVRVSALTNCEVGDGGTKLRLHMVDDVGGQVTLEVPTAIAGSLIVTIPHLMERCLQQLRGEATRLVFPMEYWSLEGVAETDQFILRLQTPDGFSVAFAVSMDDARGMAEALQVHCPARPAPMPARTLNLDTIEQLAVRLIPHFLTQSGIR